MLSIIIFNHILDNMGRWEAADRNVLRGWYIIPDEGEGSPIYYSNGKRAWSVGKWRLDSGDARLSRIKRISPQVYQQMIAFAHFRAWVPTEELTRHTRDALGRYFN